MSEQNHKAFGTNLLEQNNDHTQILYEIEFFSFFNGDSHIKQFKSSTRNGDHNISNCSEKSKIINEGHNTLASSTKCKMNQGHKVQDLK